MTWTLSWRIITAKLWRRKQPLPHRVVQAMEVMMGRGALRGSKSLSLLKQRRVVVVVVLRVVVLHLKAPILLLPTPPLPPLPTL